MDPESAFWARLPPTTPLKAGNPRLRCAARISRHAAGQATRNRLADLRPVEEGGSGAALPCALSLIAGSVPCPAPARPPARAHGEAPLPPPRPPVLLSAPLSAHRSADGRRGRAPPPLSADGRGARGAQGGTTSSSSSSCATTGRPAPPPARPAPAPPWMCARAESCPHNFPRTRMLRTWPVRRRGGRRGGVGGAGGGGDAGRGAARGAGDADGVLGASLGPLEAVPPGRARFRTRTRCDEPERPDPGAAGAVVGDSWSRLLGRCLAPPAPRSPRPLARVRGTDARGRAADGALYHAGVTQPLEPLPSARPEARS